METLIQSVMKRLFVEVEASGRHVHITKDQAQRLFGHSLTPKRPLSQPGQYLANERVTVVGPKGRFENVAVLGPERKEAQVEISMSDGRALGLTPPVRLSGQVAGSPGCQLKGPRGAVDISQGVIIAQRHIHMTPEDAQRFGIQDGQQVRLQLYGERPLVFDGVTARVSPQFATYVHLDYDEANACALKPGELGRLLP